MITQVDLRYGMVLEYINRKAEGITVRQICEKYSTTRKTLSKWHRRFLAKGREGLKDESRRPKNVRNETPEEIQQEIVRIKLENVKLGPRRIWHAVRDRIKVCITTVYNILVRKGVYRLLNPGKEGVNFYEAAGPNALWHIDIARKRLKNRGKKYIVAITDDYSRKALACDAYGCKDASTVCRTVRKAVKRYGSPDAILSDNGKQFVGKKFRRLLKRLEITHKRTAVRNPKCNGKIERWIRTSRRNASGRISSPAWPGCRGRWTGMSGTITAKGCTKA